MCLTQGVNWQVNHAQSQMIRDGVPGVYLGCMTKNDGTAWPDRMAADKWEMFSEVCEAQARQQSELPNWARTLFGVPDDRKKGRPNLGAVPGVVLCLFVIVSFALPTPQIPLAMYHI